MRPQNNKISNIERDTEINLQVNPIEDGNTPIDNYNQGYIYTSELDDNISGYVNAYTSKITSIISEKTRTGNDNFYKVTVEYSVVDGGDAVSAGAAGYFGSNLYKSGEPFIINDECGNTVNGYIVSIVNKDNGNTNWPIESYVYELLVAVSTGDMISIMNCKALLSNLGLRLTFDSIENVPVANASSVTDWNVFFDLPTNGNPFTIVQVVGNEVRLFGGSDIALKDDLFHDNNDLLSIVDTANCLTTAGYICFYGCTSLTTINMPLLTAAGISCFSNCISLTTIDLPQLTTVGDSCFSTCTSLININLPLVTTAGDGCFGDCTSLTTISLPILTLAGEYSFYNCTSLTTISLPACINLGTTVGNDDEFFNIAGNIITLTVPSALMTCNSGLPDGDIQYLQANNTVTIVTT